MVVYSVLGTHDYLAWNLRTLAGPATDPRESSGAVDFRSVDGGFENNGLRGDDGRYMPAPDTRWGGVHDEAYVVSFGPIAGYEPVKRYEYLNTSSSGAQNRIPASPPRRERDAVKSYEAAVLRETGRVARKNRAGRSFRTPSETGVLLDARRGRAGRASPSTGYDVSIGCLTVDHRFR